MRQMLKSIGTILLVVLLAAVVFTFLLVVKNGAEDKAARDRLGDELAQQSKKYDAQERKTGILAQQLEDLGEIPAVEAPKPPTNSPYILVPGPRGPRGFTGESIAGPKGDTVVGPKGDSIAGPPGESIKGDTGDTGEKGDTGDAGADGKDAPMITNIVCDGATGVFTFSDGNTIRVDNMCAAPLIPAPAE